MFDKFILKNGRLEITDKHSWGGPEFMFYYFNRQVAKVAFEGTDLKVKVITTLDPWACVSNDKRQFFARIHVLEDQLHGVDVIDLENLQALYMEYSVNQLKTVQTNPSSFAEALQKEVEYAQSQFKNYQVNNVFKNKITGIK